jgi:hypothetical protein
MTDSESMMRNSYSMDLRITAVTAVTPAFARPRSVVVQVFAFERGARRG